MTSRSGGKIEGKDGETLFRPWSGFDEADIAEASMLFEFKPREHEGLVATLRARIDMRELPTGGHALAIVYELAGIDHASGQTHGGARLCTDVPIDATVVAGALAAHCNPILEILVSQPEARDEFCKGSPRMQSVVDKLIAERAAGPGQPPRPDGQGSGRL